MRTFILTAFLSSALLLPCVCAAQGQSGTSGYGLNGPSLGLIFDSASATIRPMIGIPGATSIGGPLDAGFPVWRAAVAPGGDFALVVARGSFRLAVVRASNGAVQQLASALGEAPDLIAFSPRGRSAALYYRASGRMLVLAGLRDQAPRAFLADTSTLAVAPSLVAVSEDGASLLVTVPEGDAAGLYYLPVNLPVEQTRNPRNSAAGALEGDSPAIASSGHGFAQRVGGFQSVSALRFAGSGSDALVADQAANAVYLVQNASGASRISTLGSEKDGLSKPVAVDAMDVLRVLVVNAGTGNLTVLHRDGSPAESIACSCSPAVLHPVAGNSIYRLTEPSQQPMWLLDAGGKEARVLAVPPLRSQNAATAAARGARR